MFNTVTRSVSVGIFAAGAILAALLGASGIASASPSGDSHHTGPDYWSITGVRVGAPSQQEVSTYGGSHKHLYVEQQLYGPGVVDVPQVDTTVHQSH